MPEFDPSQVLASPVIDQKAPTPTPAPQAPVAPPQKAVPLGALGKEYDPSQVIALPPDQYAKAAEVYGSNVLRELPSTVGAVAGGAAGAQLAAPIAAATSAFPPLALGIELAAAGTGAALGGGAVGSLVDWAFPKSDRLKFGEEFAPGYATAGRLTAAGGLMGNPVKTGRALLGDAAAIKDTLVGAVTNAGLGAGTQAFQGASVNQIVNDLPRGLAEGAVLPGNKATHVIDAVGRAPIAGIGSLFSRPVGPNRVPVTPEQQRALLEEAAQAQEVQQPAPAPQPAPVAQPEPVQAQVQAPAVQAPVAEAAPAKPVAPVVEPPKAVAPAPVEKPATAPAVVEKPAPVQTEVPGAKDAFNLAGQEAGPAPAEKPAENQPDLISPTEPAYVSQARKALADLEAQGKGDSVKAAGLRALIEQPATQPEATTEVTKPTAETQAVEPQPIPETPERKSKITEILDHASATDVTNTYKVVPIIYHEGSNGKWYNATGIPHGVKTTGKTRIEGYARESKDGRTLGQRRSTPDEVKADLEKSKTTKIEQFRESLNTTSDERLQSQLEFWRAERAKAVRLGDATEYKPAQSEPVSVQPAPKANPAAQLEAPVTPKVEPNTAKPKQVYGDEPVEVSDARRYVEQQAGRKRIESREQLDAAKAIIDQYEIDQKIKDPSKGITEDELRRASDDALTEHIQEVRARHEEHGHQAVLPEELDAANRYEAEMVRRHNEDARRQNDGFTEDDIILDQARMAANKGIHLPTLPKQYGGSIARENMSRADRMRYLRTPPGIEIKRNPTPQDIAEARAAASRMESKWAESVGQGTSVSDSNVNSEVTFERFEQALKNKAKGKDVTSNVQRRYTPVEKAPSEPDPDLPFSKRDATGKTKAQIVAEANKVFREVDPASKAEAFDTPLSEYHIDGTQDFADAAEAKDQILEIARQAESADPAVAKRLRDIFAEQPAEATRNPRSDATKARELDRRVKANAENRTQPSEARSGYQGIVDRAVFEARKNRELSEKEVDGLTRILNMVGRQFLSDVRLSVRRGNESEMGQYDGVNRIVTIFKEAIHTGRFEDTAAHEIAHHLSKFLPEADRVALRAEWRSAREKFIKANPAFGELVGGIEADWAKVRVKGMDLQEAAKSNPGLTKLFTQVLGAKEPTWKVRASEDVYRMFSPSEWFAETFKDVVRSRLESDPTYTGEPKTWKDKLVGMWESIKTNFRQLFGKDRAARILSNFAKGRYEAVEQGPVDIASSDYTVSPKREPIKFPVPEVPDFSALPKDRPMPEGPAGHDILKQLRDEAAKDNPDADLIPRPKAGQSIARQAQDILTGRYFSGLSAKAHQNAERTGSDAVKAVANIIHARPGTKSNAFEADLPTATATKRAELQNKFNKAMGPLRDTLAGFKDSEGGTAKDQRETVYKALTDMITGRKGVTQGKLGETATALKELLAEIHEYRKAAGEDLGRIEDYYPAVYDNGLIVVNQNKFIKDATEAYSIELDKLTDEQLGKEAGVNPDDLQTPLPGFDGYDRATLIGKLAKRKADGLYQFHLFGADPNMETLFGNKGTSASESSHASRAFGKDAQAIMSKWQVADPFRVVGRYIMSSVKRAEVVRRFGNDGSKWKQMSEDMILEGADQGVVDEMRDLVRLAAGLGIPPRGRAEQTYLDTVNLMTAASAMGRGFLNNLVEPVSIGIRSGQPLSMVRAYGETWARFLREVPALSDTIKSKIGDTFWQQYGEHIGTIHNMLDDAWMTTHSMDMDADAADPRFRWVTNRVYKANLLEASENAKQQASHAIGYSYIRDLARWSKGEHWANKMFGVDPKQSVADNLNELGIDPAKHEEFADWVLELDKVKDNAELLRRMTDSGDPMAVLHREAMTRFSYQSSVRSNRAHKPVFQDHPIGKTLLQLMNFSYSYAAEVNSRVFDMTKRGLLPSPEGKQYNAADRVRLLAPAAGALLAVAAYRGLLELKDMLYPTESSKKRASDPDVVKWANAASYSGIFGPKVEQVMKMIKRDQAPGGPAGGMLQNIGRAGASALDSMAEGKDFDGAKKAAVKAAIPLAKGAIVAGASAVNPILGAAAVQGTNDTTVTNWLTAKEKKSRKDGGIPQL